MDNENSLDADHGQILEQLASVIAAGQDGRWADYRMRLGLLRESLVRHIEYEEEALFPVLEKGAAEAVGSLRREHVRLRQHLETIGAAAPEQDPDGCLGELDGLATLLRSHHAAERALDPQYATRMIPRWAPGPPPPMDLRGLQPPEPIVRILHALERAPAEPLRVVLPHEPLPLYELLRERGYSYAGSVRADGGFEVLIERA